VREKFLVLGSHESPVGWPDLANVKPIL
jgi:hypothetical protein